MSGIDDVDSAKLAQEQWKLSRIVANDAALTALFDEGVEHLDHRVDGTALARPLDGSSPSSVIAATTSTSWPHRAGRWTRAPCWQPSSGCATCRRTVHPRRPRPDSFAERAVAQNEVEATLRWPLRWFALRAAAVSRAGSVGRERAKDILVLENMGVRRALHELARRARRRGGPSAARLTFCVTIDELPNFLADPPAFASLIAERAATERYLNDREPPLWFEGTIPDPVHVADSSRRRGHRRATTRRCDPHRAGRECRRRVGQSAGHHRPGRSPRPRTR